MQLTFLDISNNEFSEVSDFVLNMYEHHLKRYYSDDGDASFRKRATANSIKKRVDNGARVFKIMEGEEQVGIIEFDEKILFQFFIVDEFRGRGYGRMAINWLKQYFVERKLGNAITVNATPNAYLAFEKLGFEAKGEENNKGGFVSKKMTLKTA